MSSSTPTLSSAGTEPGGERHDARRPRARESGERSALPTALGRLLVCVAIEPVKLLVVESSQDARGEQTLDGAANAARRCDCFNPDEGPRSLGLDLKRRHRAGILVGLRQDSTRLRLGDTSSNVLSAPGGGKLELDDGIFADTALNNLIAGKCRRQKVVMVRLVVGNAAVMQR